MEHTIVRKKDLNADDYLIEVRAPRVAKRFEPGCFAVLITRPCGERIPMSIKSAEDGNIVMYIKRLGKTSLELDSWEAGDSLNAVIGPMGTPPELKAYGNVAFCSDLVCGHAENYAFCKGLSETPGNKVISMQTFPTEADVYPDEELCADVCDEFYLTTADGSRGITGHYLEIVEDMLEEGELDAIFAGGDIPTLQKLGELTRPYGVPTIVTVRQIMIDGTGMCGSCRVYLDGEMKLTCIDGPMFDAHKLNFEDILSRLAMFKGREKVATDHYLNLEV